MSDLQGSYERLRVEREDRIAVITLNRPDSFNAWNDGMGREISRALCACDVDDGVRAVVMTGAGRAFCAGADLSSGKTRFEKPEETTLLRLRTFWTSGVALATPPNSSPGHMRHRQRLDSR